VTIGAKIYSALSGASGITTLTSTRIYPVILPQTPTYPAISYQRISNTGQQGSTALRETRYQINCWAATYAAAQNLATAVKTALEEYTATATSPRIKMSLVVNEIDDYDDEADVYRVIVDMILITSGD
jgi:hypothetical protein